MSFEGYYAAPDPYRPFYQQPQADQQTPQVDQQPQQGREGWKNITVL